MSWNLDREPGFGELAELTGYSVDTESSFLTQSDEIDGFQTYFKHLKPGTIIPPSKFQDWLHPDFKFKFTNIPIGFPQDWLVVVEGPHYSVFPKAATASQSANTPDAGHLPNSS